MTKEKEINWHNGALAGLEFEHEGVIYRKGSNQCVFRCGDLVMNSSLIHGAPSLRGFSRGTGTVIAISQPDEKDWPILEVYWSTAEFTKATANHLRKIVRGKPHQIQAE